MVPWESSIRNGSFDREQQIIINYSSIVHIINSDAILIAHSPLRGRIDRPCRMSYSDAWHGDGVMSSEFVWSGRFGCGPSSVCSCSTI